MRTILLLTWGVAGCALPKADPCEDPSLWYPPDGSGDVYWGCAPPQGWVETPPPETDTDTDTDSDTDTDTDTDSDSDTDTDTDADTDTGATSAPTGETGSDTGGPPPDTASTGDTGLPETGDTALGDTADTAAPPLDTAPAGTGHTGAP